MSEQSIAEVVRLGAKRLSEAGIETPDLDAEVLMRSLLRIDRARYFLDRHGPIEESTRREFEALINHRIERTSVAYLVGEREFYGHTFRVGPGVLVPRPETEAMVEFAVAWLAQDEAMASTVVDVGTGSGAIAISLAHDALEGTLGEVIAIDSSPRALAWAWENHATLGSRTIPIRFVLGNLLDEIDVPVDLVLANLPYLTPEQVDGNPDLAPEPRDALVSGADGLDLIRELIDDLPRVLAPDGAVMMEIDPAQSSTVVELAQHRFPDANVTIEQDLSRRDRFVIIDHRPPME
jgi:release factor glutamine methyltransferase